MTDNQLQNKADELFALFDKLPNNNERAKHFKEWMKLRSEQSLRMYKNETN